MNSFGQLFKISLFGESHGNSIGVLIDGMPPGIKVDVDLIKSDLLKRRPSKLYETPRVEEDEFFIESGVYQGLTVGTPILVRILNKSYNSETYLKYKTHHRPSQSDFVLKNKFKGFHNLPGSGHFSGRITTCLVVAGAFAKMVLKNVEIKTSVTQVGTLTNLEELDQYLSEIIKSKETVGAHLTTTVSGVEVGLGEPFFYGIESVISQILFSIPSIKGVSFGAGFKAVELLGSDYVDKIINKDGQTITNNSGGINRGITNGNDLVINTVTRPISSFKKGIETFNFETEKIEELKVSGSHDVFIGNRIKVIIENAIMIALLDLYLINKRYK